MVDIFQMIENRCGIKYFAGNNVGLPLFALELEFKLNKNQDRFRNLF